MCHSLHEISGETRIRGSEDSRFMDESFQRIEVGYACTDTTRG